MSNQTTLKALIELSGLSNKQYADKHGIEVTKLIGWLNGTRNVKFSTLETLSKNDGKKLQIEIKIVSL